MSLVYLSENDQKKPSNRRKPQSSEEKTSKRHAQAFESDRKLAGKITNLPRPILEESNVNRRKFEENPDSTEAQEVSEDITNILETREVPLFKYKPSNPTENLPVRPKNFVKNTPFDAGV